MEFASVPVSPIVISMDTERGVLIPAGPSLTRRMSDLDGLFADHDGWLAAAEGANPVVYSVASSPVPEFDGELPQSITTIQPGSTGGEFWMTKGHMHPDPQGEIYLGLTGRGGLLMFDGTKTKWVDMEPGTIGYIPPAWAHRSINVGDESYSFLAVYPGGAGHDYGWVLENGMGLRAYADTHGVSLKPF